MKISMQFVESLATGLFVIALSGCSILNPYESKSMCPTRDNFGKCVSMMEAYESTDEGKGKADKSGKEVVATGTQAQTNTPTAKHADPNELAYRSALYKEMTDLLRAPKTPLVKPPTVRRVLIMPYQDGALYMPRFIYVMIDKPSWILTDPLSQAQNKKAMELFDGTAK